jgi:hypothetical protein
LIFPSVLFPCENQGITIWDFIEFHASGEGSHGHEILHHVVVAGLVLNGVSMVWVSLLEEHLKVECGWPRLVLAATYDSHDTHHTRAARLLVVATIVVDRGCGLLKTLLVPFPAAPCTLPSILDGNVRRCLLAVTWGQAKLGHLAGGGVLVVMLRSSSVAFLKISTSSWKGCVCGT